MFCRRSCADAGLALANPEVRDELRAGTLVQLPLEGQLFAETFWLLWRSDIPIGTVSQQFQAFLRKRFT